MARRLQRAWQFRRPLHEAEGLEAYRVFHGFGDGVVGLNAERFADDVVVTRKAGLEVDRGRVAATLRDLHPWRRVIWREVARGHQRPQALEVETLIGPTTSDRVVVAEAGLRFLVDPAAFANSGLFLDARPARAWLRTHSEGRRILNLFSFTGSLGVAAAAGRARSVTHLDTQERSLATARENHELNHLPVDARDFVTGDAYRHLPRARRAGQRFDGIILDPPPRVPRRGHKERSGQDYRHLVPLVAPLLESGGWLLCFFSRYDRSWCAGEAEVIAAAGRALEVCWRGTSGLDFPELSVDQKLRMTAFRAD